MKWKDSKRLAVTLVINLLFCHKKNFKILIIIFNITIGKYGVAAVLDVAGNQVRAAKRE